VRKVRPERSIDCRIWCVDNADMLIDEHAALKLIHEPNVLVVGGAMLLQEVVAQAVKCPKPQLRDVDGNQIWALRDDLVPVVTDTIPRFRAAFSVNVVTKIASGCMRSDCAGSFST
jgi:hypothetical protein